MFKVWTYLLVCTLAVSAARRKYDGYQIWTATPTVQSEVDFLNSLNNLVEYDSSVILKNHEVEILIAPDNLQHVANQFHSNGLKYTIRRTNFQQYLDALWKRLDSKKQNDYDYDDFNTLESFETELSRLLDVCPRELECELQSIGTTWQGRDMWRFKIADGDSPSSRIVWLDSLTHSREWLSGATLMNILRRFVEDYSIDTDVQQLISSFTFYIMPVVNPDGYQYTWTDERFWRKNMRPANEGTGCLGVDINRNYDTYWSQHSSSICSSEVYHGPSAASEPETQAMQEQADTLNADGNLLVWISYHTAVPAWLLPYGHRINGQCQLPDNYYTEMMPAAAAAIDAIAEENEEREWDYGSVCLILATASGDSMGYNAGEADIRFVYAPELRGPGFDPDASVIPLSVRENWAGLKALLETALTLSEQ